MTQQYDDFLRTSLEQMNFPVEGLSETTSLGNDLGVDSLTASELGMRVSDAFGVSLTSEDVMSIPDLTAGEFAKLVDLRSKDGDDA
ncbi:acyl carrier protein [Rathayibacter toxicus]|uniref:Acyl carrier protein n=1 Tax=Rathayibacter toxicus TaxID=145458 RepID=A0A0C5BHR9_9MICO|nr:acyl carrier protein [Rathayibacter toxicus]AJM77820.1 hypothetical protein TI83_07405 [Rathayibacter toxicus]ALS57996.1 hypothetical protein APU90_09670 [Rathayibacter toxicus]KKM44293.1 hypothetical protein VT73_10350 [Rathayibacter toxicus]PPG20318.1 acyl carrier protein [Rathayibacter toxicus]PPG45419.1 acyl carrier protein [Rathayibacter toxicus]